MIEAIILTPDENITPGSDIGISAMVTDRDGDALQYRWESNGGIILDPEQPSTVWELPVTAKPLSYESITLTVSDGKGSATRSTSIQLSEGLFLEGHTYFAGTRIPVSGVEVTIGKFSTVSDELGYYAIPYLTEGNILITAFKEEFEYFESVVYVEHAKSTYNILMESPTQSRKIYGNIRTVDQITFEGLKVSLLNPDGSESSLYGITGPAGAYEIDGVPLGVRYLLVSNTLPEPHFLYDSVVYRIDLDDQPETFNARIKIKRTVLLDHYLSGLENWELEGSTSDGYYLLERGQHMILKDFIAVPEDAEKALLTLNSFVIGGCDLVGNVPSHRVWIINREGATMGGVSWGGEGNNYNAEVDWYPSESPNFMDIYGRDLKIKLEVYGENPCISDPFWRIYHIEFSYYY